MNPVFVGGDTAPDLTGTLSGDLTGATVELHLVTPDKTAITRPAVIVDPAAGIWRYTWLPGELVPGQWAVEAQVTYASGAVQTFPAVQSCYFRVRAPLA